MSIEDSAVKDARDQLNLVLSFFPRVDAKFSTILAINTGMLAALSASVPSLQNADWWIAIAPLITSGVLIFSYVYLYRGGFPDIKGGHSSLVYFGEIANRTESKFIDEYVSVSSESLRRDILGQVWRNSEILKEKYRCLRLAFLFMAGAVPVWVISLAGFALHRANLHLVVTHT